ARYSRLSRSRNDQARGASGGGARRIRRLGPAAGRTYLAETERQELGLRQVQESGRSDKGLLVAHGALAAGDRRPRHVGRGLHADDRRGDGSERPDDLRPRNRQTRRRAARRGTSQTLRRGGKGQMNGREKNHESDESYE